MNDLDKYIQNILSFHNPFFFALILSIFMIFLIVILNFKIILPLQKKLFIENQKHVIEKAELMALFAEMDPDPLLRIDSSGKIIQTNKECRKIFPGIEKSGKHISNYLPAFKDPIISRNKDFTETICDKIYSISIKKQSGVSFTNIYLHDITVLKKYEQFQSDNQRRFKILSEKLDNEIEELKNSLSADLHDDIGQRLIMANLKLNDPVKYSSEEIQKDIDFIYKRIRSLSKSLKPLDLGHLGLKLSLKSLVDSISETSGIKGLFEFYGSDEGLDKSLVNCIYKVVQESINNIVKHSGADEFTIQISIQKDMINLFIADDGCGIPQEYFKARNTEILGTGLFSIQERIEKLNGVMKIDSNSEIGTNLFIDIPRGNYEKVQNKVVVS